MERQACFISSHITKVSFTENKREEKLSAEGFFYLSQEDHAIHPFRYPAIVTINPITMAPARIKPVGSR